MSAGGLLPRLVGASGLAWGAVLLTRGDEVWRRVEGVPPTEVDEVAMRVLGGRHVVQGAVQLVAPRASSGVVVAVDVLHAASMGALAVASSTRRRAALVTGGAALVSAALTQVSRSRGG